VISHHPHCEQHNFGLAQTPLFKRPSPHGREVGTGMGGNRVSVGGGDLVGGNGLLVGGNKVGLGPCEVGIGIGWSTTRISAQFQNCSL